LAIWHILATPSLSLGLLLGLGLVVVALFPARFAPYDPSYQTLALQQIGGTWMTAPFPPDSRFLLGTDVMRHDLLSRLMYGTGTTLAIAAGVVVVRLAIGLGFGWLVAWHHRTLRALAGVVASATATVPSLLFAWVVITAIGPDGGFVVFLLGLGLTGWAMWTQLLNDEVRHLQCQPYLKAAEAVGVPPLGMLRRYLLPALVPVALPALAQDLAAALLLLAELGFLGVFYGHGTVISPETLQQGTPYVDFNDWGGMLAGTRLEIFGDWWLPLAPSGAFFLAILSFTLLGEGLRAILDPLD
jgi:ABC-type dipeptide/oligopeptide/nickel transport system permease subunit